jgi:hypothetical protein
MRLARTLCLTLLAATGWLAASAAVAKQTVCSITVNSPDERETFRRFLPESKYEFVDLVRRADRQRAF